MRGTAIYILSVMAKSTLAREELESAGWECHTDNATTISVPK
jgi:hypothetical protein